MSLNWGGGTLFLRGLAGISLLWSLQAAHLFWPFFVGLAFCLQCHMGPAMRFYWIFCFPFGINLAMIN